MEEITTDEVAKKIKNHEDIHLIDVREEEEVANGMIPGSKHIPLSEIPQHLDEFDKANEYIMICRSGGRSGRAQQFLEEKGIHAMNMKGGMLDWDGETEKK